MQRTITREQVGMFIALNNPQQIKEGEEQLKEKISPELFNLLKEQENLILSELNTDKTEWTFEIPDELIPDWMKETNEEEDEVEEDQ